MGNRLALGISGDGIAKRQKSKGMEMSFFKKGLTALAASAFALTGLATTATAQELTFFTIGVGLASGRGHLADAAAFDVLCVLADCAGLVIGADVLSPLGLATLRVRIVVTTSHTGESHG